MPDLTTYVRDLFGRRSRSRAEAAQALAAGLCPEGHAPSVPRALEHRRGKPLAVYGCGQCGLIWSKPYVEPQP